MEDIRIIPAAAKEAIEANLERIVDILESTGEAFTDLANNLEINAFIHNDKILEAFAIVQLATSTIADLNNRLVMHVNML